MQKIVLMGRLGNDAQIQQSKNGGTFVTFNLAAFSNRKDDKTVWYRITSFNEQHKKGILSYLKKGTSVIITGDINPSVNNGYLNLDVTADSISFAPISNKSNENQTNETKNYQQSTTTQTSVAPTDDSITCGKLNEVTSQIPHTSFEDDDDDLPF